MDETIIVDLHLNFCIILVINIYKEPVLNCHSMHYIFRYLLILIGKNRKLKISINSSKWVEVLKNYKLYIRFIENTNIINILCQF